MTKLDTHSPAPAVADFINKEHRLLIGGKYIPSASGKTFEVFDPATDTVLAHVPEGAAEDIERAVRAARNAFEGPWREMKPSERGQVIWRLADLIEEHSEEFAQLDALDNGKPVTVARAIDVPHSIDLFRYMAGYATKLEGGNFDISLPGEWHAYTRKEPIGVVGAIIPWNFPLFMISVKLAPALAAGNTVVLKPAEQTPLSALRFGELAEQAGFPAGVINIVTGFGAMAGDALVRHADVNKISFTGSQAIGKQIGQAAASDLKKVTLELGGKSPNIIFADADIDIAIAGAAKAIFFNHGQACVAGSRLYVQRNVFDTVLAGVGQIAREMRLGPALDPESEMGPLVSRRQQERVLGYIAAGHGEGARTITAGDVPPGDGYYVAPTILVDVEPHMSVQREEIFGPVVTAVPFDDVDEVIRLANDTDMGLAAGCFTTNLSTAHKVSAALRAGNVYVNCWGVNDASMPFGGYKQSGWGREFGREVLEYYTETKSVFMKL